MSKTNEKKIETIRKLCEEGYGKLYAKYSGRFMYGKHCVGVVTKDALSCVEEAAARGIRGALTDDMGLQTIVYWPKVVIED